MTKGIATAARVGGDGGAMVRSFTDEAQQRIGYVFRQPRLLDEALTHTSYVYEAKSQARAAPASDNERLEFLGDAVLALVVSEHVAKTWPGLTEGVLSKLKAGLVSEVSLAKAARRLGLGELLRLGRGEELTKGREKSSLLADALEALIAAIYLDGGLDSARTFTLRVLAEEVAAIREPGGEAGDDKTRLQEWCQKRFETLPQYVTVKESGPDHQKTFEVEVKVGGDRVGSGTGRTKKEAEQLAAKQALERIGHG